MRILVTGATGYIGGRLVSRLLERGHELVVLARDPSRIARRAWLDRVTVVKGDLLDADSLGPAFEGVEAAYYLVHSMSTARDFAAQDRRAAESFAVAGKDLKLVVYLGGLLPDAPNVSEHLKSRAEVGAILRDRLPVTEFRAGPIIGSGSASFEMVRYLTERLPVMVAPRWIENRVQPIAVRDVLAYLMGALEKDTLGVVDVGANVLTFKEMMTEYAKVRGLSRLIVPLPVLAPWLAARWVGLVTPIPNSLAIPLVKGLVNPVVTSDDRAREIFPEIEPIDYTDAVRLAVERIEHNCVETRWSSALGSTPTYRMTQWEGLIRAERTRHVEAEPATVFSVFSSLGGDKGWLVWNWAWWLRGLFDRMIGGPGLRRGRRHALELLPGEAVDFWRVEEVDPPRLLRLRAEMKLPGRAWLQFEAIPEDGGTRLVQSALFEPVGLLGVVYWNSMWPAHLFIFPGMINRIVREAEEAQRSIPTQEEEPAGQQSR
ncbi:3 beta-hydroxysteroid dehydrogenase/Delta 5--_4-isomerase [Planctomycetes bacterium Pan216]|uniref:3 beta-hydroxysteroid dehydrogenase/Delta 5-->4-isomerase n=1 Tax=Kolteria novifilia TaxID=2527975 RepID=A0A518AZ85_9BACT|nr:3 beta-hydroxysteroid dehydrogenase/Delta 5-->4-isomerase [Planctomycetes bacterium Pan216]